MVFDSYSTDQTEEIAHMHGAIVNKREFDNYANQRNAALEAVPERTEWILMIDADEIVTAELQEEILALLAANPKETMFLVRRKDYFRDKWIRYSSGYPTWFPRLFKKGKVLVEREVNEEYKNDGVTGKLTEHLDHFPFNKGMEWWLRKHQRYAEMEAVLMQDEILQPIGLRNLFSRDPILRRRAQKRLSYHLPFRPEFVFFAFYILKKGFLDGKAGFEFCALRYRYECMIKDQFKQLKRSKT